MRIQRGAWRSSQGGQRPHQHTSKCRMQKKSQLIPEQNLLAFVTMWCYANSYPDGDHYAHKGKESLDVEQAFYHAGLRFGDVVVTDGEEDDDGGDEGEDVGRDGDGAASHQEVGRPILAIVLVADPVGKHHPSDDQLEETLDAR